MHPVQMYHLPQSNLVVENPTTPGQFDFLSLIQSNLVVQSPTTPGQFFDLEECRHTQVRCTLLTESNLVVESPTIPGQFDPSPFPLYNLVVQRPYYTRSV